MSSPPSTIAKLHRDTVHSIFAFLALRDLAAASNSCKEWREWAASAPIRATGSVTIHQGNSGWLWANLLGPMDAPGEHVGTLARHLGTLRIVPERALVSLLLSLRAVPSVTRLKCVWAMMPLSALLAFLKLPAALASHSLPPKLVELHIGLNERPTIREQSAMFNASIALAARCCPMLRKLVLTNPLNQGAELRLDVTPLAALSELEDVTLEVQPSVALVHALGSIRTLKAIRFPSSEPVDDPVPFLEGHSMHALQEFGVRSEPLNGAQLVRLASLVPTLTVLPQCGLYRSALSSLHLFPYLTTVQLSGAADAYDPAIDNVPVESLVPLLLPCTFLPRLTRLRLTSLRNMSLDLSARLFGCLSAVRILELESVSLESLSWLQPMRCLEQLSLAMFSARLAHADLAFVEGLPALLHLHVMEGECRLLQPADVERLSVPSAALPRLQCFHYSGQPAEVDSAYIQVETPSFCRRTLPLQYQSFEEPMHCLL